MLHFPMEMGDGRWRWKTVWQSHGEISWNECILCYMPTGELRRTELFRRTPPQDKKSSDIPVSPLHRFQAILSTTTLYPQPPSFTAEPATLPYLCLSSQRKSGWWGAGTIIIHQSCPPNRSNMPGGCEIRSLTKVSLKFARTVLCDILFHPAMLNGLKLMCLMRPTENLCL